VPGITSGISLTLDWKFRRRGNAAPPIVGRADLLVRREFAANERSDVCGQHRKGNDDKIWLSGQP
jgi:hypothetical protein